MPSLENWEWWVKDLWWYQLSPHIQCPNSHPHVHVLLFFSCIWLSTQWERQVKATQHNRKTKQHNTTCPRQVFFKEKLAASGGTWTHNTLILGVYIYNIYMYVPCTCRSWQWQFGALSIFLGWLNLIIFIRKLPLTGIYVVMFVDIFYTFCRLFFLSILLVIAFGLSFYMAFNDPDIEVSGERGTPLIISSN